MSKLSNDTLPEGIVGLDEEEVFKLKVAGKVNVSDTKSGKSYFDIVKDNLFTFFNLIYLVVTAILLVIGSFTNFTYLAVVIPNILIGIIQQIRAKRTVEKLSVATESKATVIRGGKVLEVSPGEIVLGDILFVETGGQILSDGVVISGLAEANESMLTGESRPIKKTEGESVLGGSFLVSGAIYVKVTAVGSDNYMYKIEKAAKSFKAPKSNLFRDLNKLIRYITVILVPMAALVFFSNWQFNSGAADRLVLTIEKTCGSVIGMIPAGAYLLITLALSLSVVKLGKRDTLVQDMYSIEMLAAADVVCLDKTGTITDGTMTVSALLPLADVNEEELGRIIALSEGAFDSMNNTSKALVAKFGEITDGSVTDKIPFSSDRKYSSIKLSCGEVYSIGAPHFVKCPVSDELEEIISKYADEGERVLLVVKQSELEAMGEAIALISISDRIRPNAKETIEKFQAQGVTVKVISGDHAKTVSSIARRVGVINAEKYVSCENVTDEELAALANEYAVFGRVSPEQKVLLIKTLRAHGHTVAMTGDGVNDTLALKESDCAIAMAEGSDVAKKISQIVLLKSDFGALPDVVKEGRKCINNVRLSSALFLMKTLLTIFTSILGVALMVAYPFEPKQMLVLELLVIGLSSLALTLEPNERRTEGGFIFSVLSKSFPLGLAMFIPVVAILTMLKIGTVELGVASAVATITVTLVGLVNLGFLCIPYTKWRLGVVSLTAALTAILFSLSLLLGDILKLSPIGGNVPLLLITLGIGVVSSGLINVITMICKNISDKRKAEQEAAKKSV